MTLAIHRASLPLCLTWELGELARPLEEAATEAGEATGHDLPPGRVQEHPEPQRRRWVRVA